MTDTLEGLKASIKGSVFESDDEGYDITRWARNAQIPAQLVIVPVEAEDISKAIIFARTHGLPLGIRGGGHHTSGSSSTDGLLIDMRGMKKIRADIERNVVFAQGGTQSHELDLETLKHGMGTTVGVCSQVGIVGHSTEGGLGASAGKYGAGVDNVVGATVVLANGDIVEANAETNPDLYWGIRGGGGNFGVIVEIQMKLHPQRKDIYTINYAFLPSQLRDVVHAINAWLVTQQETEVVGLLMALGADGNPYVIVIGWNNSDQESGENGFQKFLDLKPVVATSAQMPYEKFSDIVEPLNAIKGNKIMVGPHFDNFDIETVLMVYDAWYEIAKKAPASVVQYEFYSYRKLASVPVEATAFAQRSLMKVAFLGNMWPEDSSYTLPQAREDLLRLKNLISSSSSKEAQESLGYANYADAYSTFSDTDEYARRIFGSNYPRLQKVKERYDPDNVWNRWFAVRPAV